MTEIKSIWVFDTITLKFQVVVVQEVEKNHNCAAVKNILFLKMMIDNGKSRNINKTS